MCIRPFSIDLEFFRLNSQATVHADHDQGEPVLIMETSTNSTVSNTDIYDHYDNDLSSFDEIIRHRPRHKSHLTRLFKIIRLALKAMMQRRRVRESTDH